METGVIAEWLLKVGDKFEAGTAICQVNTDKATASYDATEEGYIAKILIGANEELKVGTFVSYYCLDQVIHN
jgi:pyruvate dehydrogenase E2 component (dihydrolipoamide acetyltransferase)